MRGVGGGAGGAGGGGGGLEAADGGHRRGLLPAALAAAEAFPQVYAAIGRHPNYAKGFDEADLAELKALAAHPRCVAIGETGLDFYRDHAPPADQERAFSAQIALARELSKPLVIHARAADEATLAAGRRGRGAGRGAALLRDAGAPGGVPGAGLRDQLRREGDIQERPDLARAARRVPAERLLVETDAPYLTPQRVRKYRNEPAFVAHTLKFLADLRGVRHGELGADRGGHRAHGVFGC